MPLLAASRVINFSKNEVITSGILSRNLTVLGNIIMPCIWNISKNNEK